MAYTLAKEDVVLVALDVALTDLSDDEWEQVLLEVTSEVGTKGWGTDALAKMGAQYLAAHKALLRKRAKAGGAGSAAAGPLISVTAGKVSKTYASPAASSTTSPGDAQLGTTTYGLEFQRLRRLFSRRMAVT